MYHGRLTSGLRLPLLLRWREVVGRVGYGQGVSKALRQKHRNNKRLMLSPGCSSNTFANDPAATNNPGYSCIGLKTGRARKGCGHGSNNETRKPATRPLLCQQKTLPTGAQYLAPKPCPQPRQAAAHRRGCYGGSSASGRLSGWGTRFRCQSHEHEQGRSHCRSVIFIVIAKTVVDPMIFLASLEITNNISTVPPYLCTVARHVVCYFGATVASHFD